MRMTSCLNRSYRGSDPVGDGVVAAALAVILIPLSLCLSLVPAAVFHLGEQGTADCTAVAGALAMLLALPTGRLLFVALGEPRFRPQEAK